MELKGYVYYCDGWVMTRQNKEDEAVSQFHKAISFLEKAPQTDANIARKLAVYKERRYMQTNAIMIFKKSILLFC
jgi:Tfp pilus assembly protein PilF